MRLRLWLLAMDVTDWLGCRRLYLACVRRAGDATDWGEGADCSDGSGETPF